MDKLGNIKAMGKKQQQRPIVSWEKVMRMKDLFNKDYYYYREQIFALSHPKHLSSLSYCIIIIIL